MKTIVRNRPVDVKSYNDIQTQKPEGQSKPLATQQNFFASERSDRAPKASITALHPYSKETAMQQFFQKFNNQGKMGRVQTASSEARQPEKTNQLKENSFTRKLRENRAAYQQKQHPGYAFYQAPTNKTSTGGIFKQHQNVSSQETDIPRVGEFSTPNCSDLNAYHFGNQIGSGAYAIVKECFHKQSGEKVAIK
jgi:hypothetical protein